MPKKLTKLASVFPEYQPQKAALSPDLQTAAALQQISLLYAKHYFPNLSAEEWALKAQWQPPQNLDPIPGTERFSVLPKRLIAVGDSYLSFCNCIRQFTSLGWAAKEFEVFGDGNLGDIEISKWYQARLVDFQGELVKREYNKKLPLSPYGAALRELNKLNRRSDGMAIVIQNANGSWPKFNPNNFGSGILAIGSSVLGEPDWV